MIAHAQRVVKEEPLSDATVHKEVKRLTTASALPKVSASAETLFAVLEKHLKTYVDRYATVPCVPDTYLYMSDEGFLTVFAIVYTRLRAACKELFAKMERKDEHVFLTLSGETFAEDIGEALAVKEKTLSALYAIASAAGFSLFFTVASGKLCASFRFVRFRAIPVSSYSCSEEFVFDKTHRAFNLFAYLNNEK